MQEDWLVMNDPQTVSAFRPPLIASSVKPQEAHSPSPVPRSKSSVSKRSFPISHAILRPEKATAETGGEIRKNPDWRIVEHEASISSTAKQR